MPRALLQACHARADTPGDALFGSSHALARPHHGHKASVGFPEGEVRVKEGKIMKSYEVIGTPRNSDKTMLPK